MAHEIAKVLLEQARTESDRSRAVKVAMQLGMPLHEIEAYLDWLDLIRGTVRDTPSDGDAGRPEG